MAPLDYDLAFLLKPFRLHLAVDALPSKVFSQTVLTSAGEELPPPLDINPGPRVEWDLNPPDTCAARHTLWSIRLPHSHFSSLAVTLVGQYFPAGRAIRISHVHLSAIVRSFREQRTA